MEIDQGYHVFLAWESVKVIDCKVCECYLVRASPFPGSLTPGGLI